MIAYYRWYASCGNISVGDLNRMERDFCQALDYRFVVTKNDYQQYVTQEIMSQTFFQYAESLNVTKNFEHFLKIGLWLW